MKILCTRENLLYGVQVVQRAVSNKNTLPILSGILLKTENNHLHFSATDLEMGIHCSVPVQTIEEGSIVLPARIFAELVRRLPDTSIELSVKPESRSVSVRYNSSETSLNGLDPEEFPIIPELEESSSISVKSSLLRSMIKQTIFATAQDENRPIFTGVLSIIENNSLKMVSTDTHRLSFRTGNLESELESPWQSIIPAKVLSEVSKLIKDDEEMIQIVLHQNQVMFRFEDIILVSRLIEGQFPNYKQVIPKNCSTKLRILTRSLLEAVERASLLAREGNHVIKLKTIEDNLVITSNSPEVGNAYEEIPIETQGDETQIAFNSKYLTDVLKVIDTEEIIVELSGSISPGIIRPMERNNFIYLILPVRTN